MKVLALAGGVGGAKLVEGLAAILPSENLTVVVNTGDDFRHFGLKICPDLDTVCYTLAGLANPETGWGRANESWAVRQALTQLKAPDWFQLGDGDLATHLERSRLLQAGHTLSELTTQFCKHWGIAVQVLPMSNDETPTLVHSDEGLLAFQEYFVARHCEPRVSGFVFKEIENASPAPGVLEAIAAADQVIICPSNPWVSIAPILAVPGIRPALAGKPITAVSPIIAGHALKGPAAKMYSELGFTPSALAVAKHYEGLISGFVLDQQDAGLSPQLAIPQLCTDTIMRKPEDRRRLATEILHWLA